MRIITNNIDFAQRYIGPAEWDRVTIDDMQTELKELTCRIVGCDSIFAADVSGFIGWDYLLCTDKAVKSQYDELIKMTSDNIQLPDALMCIAGSGERFHGFRNRPWAAVDGNLHLSVHLTPKVEAGAYALGYTIISSNSVAQAINQITGTNAKAEIKWVNDIVINDDKVSGVLAQTQMQGQLITDVVLGIGINVNVCPDVPATAYVPRPCALTDYGEYTEQQVFAVLAEKLINNYRTLISGDYKELLSYYRDNSAIIGRNVEIRSDDGSEKVIAQGKVEQIGENLELMLDAIDQPIVTGRLILTDKCR